MKKLKSKLLIVSLFFVIVASFASNKLDLSNSKETSAIVESDTNASDTQQTPLFQEVEDGAYQGKIANTYFQNTVDGMIDLLWSDSL